jgi:hypothetical protein
MSVSLIDGHIDPDTIRMTDKEIIKALELCGKDPFYCVNCPFYKNHFCREELREKSLDLINRQQSAIDVYMQENDKLKTAYIQVSEDRNEIRKETEAEIKEWKRVVETWQELHEKDKAEIDRLTINMNAFGLGMKQEKERADTIRAEAIKEFAERLKDDSWFTDLFDRNDYPVRAVTKEDIDNLVKEMVGDDK